jgi:hypothetical protein
MKEYFSHDYSSRSDQKIKRLLYAHGMTGYGIYWSIIEMLYINNNSLLYDTQLISYELRVDENIIDSVLNDFELFIFNDGRFYSNGVNNRLEIRGVKSANAKASADKRWDDGKSNTRVKASNTIFYIIRIFNENESFLKCGITNESVSRRYSGKLNGYKYELLFSHDETQEKGINLEREIGAKFRHYNPKIKFPGSLECYFTDDYESISDFAMLHYGIRNAKKERKGKEINKSKENKEEYNANKLAARSKEFEKSLIPYIGTYSKEMIREFADYWTEPNKSKTKMLFEMKPTWDTSKRLATWARNDFSKKQYKHPSTQKLPSNYDKF